MKIENINQTKNFETEFDELFIEASLNGDDSKYQVQSFSDVQSWAENFDGEFPRNGQWGYFDTPICGTVEIDGEEFYIVAQ